MEGFYKFVDGLNDRIGRTVAWLTLGMVLVQFAVVLMRYVFSANEFLGLNSVIWQEAVVYMHGALFTMAAAYTLLHNGHVRVDIFYRPATQEQQDRIDLLGSLFLLAPVCILIIWSSWPLVEQSWRNSEGSTEAIGIPYRWALRTTLLIMPALLFLQALSTAAKCWMRLRGDYVEDPHRDEVSLD